jgi:hypothetical protein
VVRGLATRRWDGASQAYCFVIVRRVQATSTNGLENGLSLALVYACSGTYDKLSRRCK